MALLPYSVERTLTSSFPSHGNEPTVPVADPSHPQFIYGHKSTKNTFNNRTALNQNRMSTLVDATRQYASGYRIVVTWYSFMHNFTDKRSTHSTYTHILNNVHKAYKKIIGLELVLSGAMDFSFDSDLVETTVEGTCKLQGGIDAHVGDIFLYEKMPGQYGLFAITGKERLSDSTGSYQDVSFVLKEFPSNETLNVLEDCVLETYYYTEMSTLGKRSVVVERSDYVNQLNLLALRKELIDYYHEQFFSLDNRTFVRPDRVYDPYVVQFMRSITNYDDHRYYPPNQLIKPTRYEQSIWSLLERGATRYQNICTTYRKTPIRHKNMSAFVTSLTGYQLVELDVEGTTPYVLLDEEYRTLLGIPQEPIIPNELDYTQPLTVVGLTDFVYTPTDTHTIDTLATALADTLEIDTVTADGTDLLITYTTPIGTAYSVTDDSTMVRITTDDITVYAAGVVFLPTLLDLTRELTVSELTGFTYTPTATATIADLAIALAATDEILSTEVVGDTIEITYDSTLGVAFTITDGIQLLTIPVEDIVTTPATAVLSTLEYIPPVDPDQPVPVDATDTLKFLYKLLNDHTVDVPMLERIDTWCTELNHQFYCIPIAIHAINRTII